MKELKGSWMSHRTAWGTIHFWLIHSWELYVLEDSIMDIQLDVEFKHIYCLALCSGSPART